MTTWPWAICSLWDRAGAVPSVRTRARDGSQAIVRPDRNRLANASFEAGAATPLPATADTFWEPHSTGYAVDTAEKHSGARSIACMLPPAAGGPIAKGKGDSAEFNVVESPASAGASCEVLLDQSQPKGLFVVGWSKAADVSGAPGSDDALYVDLRYQDGTPARGGNEGRHDGRIAGGPVRGALAGDLVRPGQAGL